MKKFNRILGALGCSLLVLPMIVSADTVQQDYEIGWGSVEGKTCGIGGGKSELTLYNNTCNPDGTDEVIASYSFDDTVLSFEKDKKAYHFAGGINDTTIVVSGNNTINYLDGTVSYIIKGDGTLTINLVHEPTYVTDEDGNVLYQAEYYIPEKLTSVQIVNAEGERTFLKSMEDLESQFEELKKYNPELADQTYNEENVMIFTSVITSTEDKYPSKEWIEKNITTDMKITYTDDAVIFSSNNILTSDNVIFESKDTLNGDYKLEVTDLTSSLSEEDIAKLVTEKQTLLGLYDISVLNGSDVVVPMEDGEFTIRIKLTNDMQKYNKLTAVYVENGEIKETFPVTVEDGYAVFTTTHLSNYAILGENVENPSNPSTSDNIMIFAGILTLGLAGSISSLYLMKKRAN